MKQEPASVRFFFFSSRRRHTRCSRDWSSDVCSSDLQHEVRLRVHFPQNESHLNRAKSRPVWFRLASTRLPPSSCDARGLGHGLPHLIVQLLELFAVANGKRWLRRAKRQDRKSTRLNSSHGYISYAVFC